MPTVKPLVAAGVDRPVDAWAGVWIAEDIELITQGVRDGSWIDGALGVAGASLDALARSVGSTSARKPKRSSGV